MSTCSRSLGIPEAVLGCGTCDVAFVAGSFVHNAVCSSGDPIVYVWLDLTRTVTLAIVFDLSAVLLLYFFFKNLPFIGNIGATQ